MFTPRGRFISGGSFEQQFSPDVYKERKTDMIWWSIWWSPVSIRPWYGTYQFDMFEMVKTIFWYFCCRRAVI